MNGGTLKIYDRRTEFYIEGAKRSRYNAAHWFRYLRKAIVNGEVSLTLEDVNAIINSGELTMFQVVTLKRAMQPGTATNQYVDNLNRRTTTPLVKELQRKYGHV